MDVAQPVALSALPRPHTAPRLFLSSEGAGWDDLLLRAYHEPPELEGWVEPSVPDVALVFLTRGAMRLEQRRADGAWQAQPIHQGDLFLRPGGSVPPELRWKSLSAEPMQTIHLHLSSRLLARTAEAVAGRVPARPALIGRSGFRDPLLTQIGLALAREAAQPTAAGHLYAQTAAQLLAVHLLRHYAAGPLDVPERRQQGLSRRQMQEIAEFIRGHLTEDLSLDELARQVNFSPYYFARLFRQATGESPHQFVLRERVDRAQALLKKTDLPLTNVALESGFANQPHLTQVFKRRLGLTPGAYRHHFRSL